MVQLYSLLATWLCPIQTTLEFIEENISDINHTEFPVIFKICAQPAFNIDKLHASGYEGVDSFFLGHWKENSSVYGWFGHQKEAPENITIKGKAKYMNPS